MAKALAQVYSFTAGKLDRLLSGRRDLKAYYSGALDMLNVVPLQLGGFTTRPGLRKAGEIPEAATGARLARFEYSTEAAYLIVFVDLAAHVYFDGAHQATVITPWTAVQLAELDWTQSLDTMILVHPAHAPRKLMRTGSHTSWALSTLAFTNIPTHDFGSGAEAVWSATRGWPRSVTLHQGRLMVGGSRDLPTYVWGSKSGSFFDFGETAPPTGPLDDDSVSAALDADQVNGIRQVFGTDDLFMFSSGGPWVVASADEPITPNNFLPLQYARVPASAVRPQVINGNVVYVSAADDGAHSSLFELAWDDGKQSYYAQDLALRCPSLMRTPIDVAVRDTGEQDAAPTVVSVNGADGTAGVLTPNRFESVTAWSEWQTAGIFKAACVVGNTLHFLSERTIDGSARYFLERLDASLHLDCAITATAGTPQTAWSGLDHLEGCTVTIIGDGHVQTPKVVTDGAVTLDEAATSVEIGLDWNWAVTPMPIEAQLSDGTLIGHRYRPVSVAVQMVDTAGLSINGKRQDFRRFNAAAFDQALPLFSGVHKTRLLGWRYGGDAAVILSGRGALKSTVLSVTVEVAGP